MRNYSALINSFVLNFEMKKNQLADIIEGSINEIVEDWAKAVRDNNTVTSSEDLSEGGLRDHLPQVLEEIIALLRSGDALSVHNTREARVSAYTRYTQNYRIAELITEIALLREVIFRHLSASLLNQPTTLDLPEYTRAADLINSYLDEEMRYGSSIFCESIKNLN